MAFLDSTLLEKTFSPLCLSISISPYNQTDFYKYLFLPTKRLYKFNKILVKSVCKNKGNLEGEKRRFNFLLCAQNAFLPKYDPPFASNKKNYLYFFLFFCVPFFYHNSLWVVTQIWLYS